MTASIHSFRIQAAAAAIGEEPVAQRLTTELQRAFGSDALALFDRFLDEADDRLFEYSQRSNGAAQLDYLQSMRRLRAQHATVRGRFAEALQTLLEPGWRPHTVAASEARQRGLSMIEDQVVEERLAVQATAQRLEAGCEAALFDLKQRLESSRRTAAVKLLDVQFAPAALCQVAADSLRQAEPGADLMPVLLKIFEQVAGTTLDAIYGRLSGLLGAHGFCAAATAAATAAAAPAADRPMALEAGTAALAIRAIAANVEALGALLHRSGQTPAQCMLNAQLSEAVRSAQCEVVPGWVQAVLLRAAASSWLFDQILADGGIPPSLRSGLEVLRGPFARAALQENDFIDNASHPLRKLIQQVATLAATARVAGPREVSGIRDFIAEMGFTLESPAQRADLHAAQAVDEPVVQSFAAAVREAGQLRRNTLVLRARELSVQAIGKGVERHLAGVDLPPPVAQVLEQVFGPLLGLVLLRAGRESEAFRQARAALDEFLGTMAHGLAGAPSEASFTSRIASLAAAAGLSAAFQAELPGRIEAALSLAPLLLKAGGAAAGKSALSVWDQTPGVEVAEVSSAEIEACAQALFVPGAWFRLSGQHGGTARWMQVESCDTAQGQVRLASACGRQQMAQSLQALVFEVLSGRCQRIGGSSQSERLVSRLAATLGLAPVAETAEA